MKIRKLERWINISASFCSLCAFMIFIGTRNEGFNLQIVLRYLFSAVFIIAIWGLIIHSLYRFWKWGKERDKLFFVSMFLIVVLIAVFGGIFVSMLGVQIIWLLLEGLFMLLADMQYF